MCLRRENCPLVYSKQGFLKFFVEQFILRFFYTGFVIFWQAYNKRNAFFKSVNRIFRYVELFGGRSCKRIC